MIFRYISNGGAVYVSDFPQSSDLWEKCKFNFFFICPFFTSIRLVDFPKSIFATLSVALSLNTKLEDTSVKNWLAVRSVGS